MAPLAMRWTARALSAHEGLSVTSVDVDHVRSAFAGLLRREEIHRIRDVTRQHLALEQRAIPVVSLELLTRIDSISAGALASPAALPDSRAFDDRIRVDRVHPDSMRCTLECETPRKVQ